jgi:alpha-beta hydrolase superfamily lysophospholipase
VARAHDAVTTWGFTVVAIDAPGHGDRPRATEDEQARADMRQAMATGDTERFESVSVRYAISLADRARRITVPVQFLLPWDDEYVDRQSALALFDAFATKEKTLHANPGDHRTIRWVGVDNEFLPRHLGRA